MHGDCTVWVCLWKLVHDNCTAEMCMTPVQLLSVKTSAWQLYSLGVSLKTCAWQSYSWDVHDPCAAGVFLKLVHGSCTAQLCLWYWRPSTSTAGILLHRVMSLLIDSLTCLFLWFWRQVCGTCTVGIWPQRLELSPYLNTNRFFNMPVFVLVFFKTSVWHLYSWDWTSKTSVKSLLIDSLICLFNFFFF